MSWKRIDMLANEVLRDLELRIVAAGVSDGWEAASTRPRRPVEGEPPADLMRDWDRIAPQRRLAPASAMRCHLRIVGGTDHARLA